MRYLVYYEIKGKKIHCIFDTEKLVVKRLKWLFHYKIEAVAFQGNNVVGRVWADSSQRTGMNWYFNNNK